MPYTPSQYWSKLHDRRDLSAVGQSGLSNEMNQQLYRILGRNLRWFFRRHGVTRLGPTALEVGAGSGYWLGMWREYGASRIDACDLVPAAVQDLKERFGNEGRFWVADIGSDDIAAGAYDFVACMNVLLHVTDDARFDHALATLAKLVRPGGRLLLTEPILFHDRYARPYDPDLSSRARPLARYRDPLESRGLRLDAIAAATAIGNNPIEGRWPPLHFFWRGAWFAANVPARIHPANSRWVGWLLYAFDPLVMAVRAAPSSKFALFSRPT
jgi:SAM-dependent methyltransferase